MLQMYYTYDHRLASAHELLEGVYTDSMNLHGTAYNYYSYTIIRISVHNSHNYSYTLTNVLWETFKGKT